MSVSELFRIAFIEKDRWKLYLQGLDITIEVSIFAAAIGLVLGTIAALMKLHTSRSGKTTILGRIADIYIDVIRGTPSVLQLMIMWFIIMSNCRNGILVASLSFGINSGAYVAEIIRAGIQSIDPGQMEAARSLGLTYWRSMYRVVLPQAIKNMVPSIVNQFIITLKDTSILSIIGFPELVNKAQNVIAITFQSFQVWTIVGLMYLVVILILQRIAKILERRLNYDRRAEAKQK